jgi:hypothetical protein
MANVIMSYQLKLVVDVDKSLLTYQIKVVGRKSVTDLKGR